MWLQVKQWGDMKQVTCETTGLQEKQWGDMKQQGDKNNSLQV